MCHTGEYGCGHHSHHVPEGAGHHRWGWGCCCGPGYGMRRFPTREEIIAQLVEYLKQLQAEIKGVEERIAEFKKTG